RIGARARLAGQRARLRGGRRGGGARGAPPRRGTLAVTAVGSAAVLAGNPRDGYLDRLVPRRLSPVVTRLLLPTPVTPNAVTVFGTAVGVAGGSLIGSAGTAGIVAGVLCLLASGVLDCSDGELARLRGESSRLGHVLDVAGDTLVAVSVLP